MILPLIGTGILLLPTLVIALVWALVRRLRRRPVAEFLRRALWVHFGLLVVHLLITVPALLGWVGSRLVDTRPDERGYAGPRILADGTWAIQDRDSLAAERRGEAVASAEVRAAAEARRRSDSVLGLYRVAATIEPPRAIALLVHGLFRSAMEVEPVGAMLRQLGCEVWLVEMRNHGHSVRGPGTFGLRDADDLVATLDMLRGEGVLARAPVILFGVSLGTATVALAAPRIPELRGLVLDAPLEDLTAAAHRMLGRTRNQGRRVVELWDPWRSLTLRWMEWWSDFELASVRPLAALTALPGDVAVLVIGAGDDDRAPPEVVEALFRSLPAAEGRKELWIRQGAGHGQVWAMDPSGYRRRLEGLLRRATGGVGR